ncbi:MULTISPECIES: hypothetical protein [unclassified Streptomyces]|jgi:hypothetical protein|uniref:hypothetical protein n=1 Tax=unclassified Streptomyces TaxID=2593676 RepID=UPI0005270589|nr:MULTISPECIES: hypothetical protein [unclassified Streptomyces]WOX10669.1 hypothetical protein R2B38_18280 [Streptomyces sp. N50]WSL09121.1 hypothetical protein OG194_25030 [Streptomyces sp. NBC_01288]WSX12570.1 hypothetical protein OG496_26945 [Streptomyces sp. NBC_00988]
MIKQVSHTVTDTGAAGLGLALGVAYELHAPAARAPEVAPVPELMGLRTSAARPHHRKVPLNRLQTMRG